LHFLNDYNYEPTWFPYHRFILAFYYIRLVCKFVD